MKVYEFLQLVAQLKTATLNQAEITLNAGGDITTICDIKYSARYDEVWIIGEDSKSLTDILERGQPEQCINCELLRKREYPDGGFFCFLDGSKSPIKSADETCEEFKKLRRMNDER